MLDRKALGERIEDARFYAGGRERKHLSLRRLGALVAKAMRRPKPYTGSQVKAFRDGDTEAIAVEFVYAVAVVCGVPPGWLAFGEDRDIGKIPTKAEAPPLPIGQRGSSARVAKRGKAG